MGYDTKPNLDNSKFEQRVDDVLDLSGQINVIGGLNIMSGATFNIVLNDKASENYLVYYNITANTVSRGIANYVSNTVLLDTQDPTGFLDNKNIIVTYDSTNRNINLCNNSGIYYYWNGIKHYLGTSWTSSGHTNNACAWYLYSNDGSNFNWSNIVWSFSDVQVAARPANSNWAIREVHGYMPHDVHEELHQNFGTYRKTGFGFTNNTYALQPAIPSNSGNTIGFEAGIVKDEDLETSLSAWIEGSYSRLYFTGSGSYNIETGQTAIFRIGTTYPKYNPYDGSGFTEVEMSSGEYANWYVIRIPVTADVNSQQYRAIILQPQYKYSLLSTAQAENPQNLFLGELAGLLPEYVLVERITMYTNSSYTTALGRVRIEALSILSGNRFNQTNTTVGLGAITAGNVSVVPVSPFTSINLQSLSDEYANKLNTTITTTSNGLTKIGNNIVLGGALTGDTCVNITNGCICFTDTTGCNVTVFSCEGSSMFNSNTKYSSSLISEPDRAYLSSANCSYSTEIAACNQSIRLEVNDNVEPSVHSTFFDMTSGSVVVSSIEYIAEPPFSISFSGFSGITYGHDYSAHFVARSIPDVAWVTGKTSTTGVQTVNNGLTKIGTNVVLGGTLTGNTTININSKNLVMSNGYLTMTSLSGTTNRMVQADTCGSLSACAVIISGKITNSSTISQLTGSTNWNIYGQYIGLPITNTYEGQYYRDSCYYYTAYSDDNWSRLTLAQLTKEAIAGLTSGATPTFKNACFTSMTGTTSRIVEANTSGLLSACTAMITGKISNATVISLLTSESNWDVNGQYCGTSITGTYEGQYYRDCNYFYFSYDDNDWTRTPRV